MSLQIGRCGLDVAMGDQASIAITGSRRDEISMAGWLTASSQADARVLRAQLLGHVGNEWEPVVPIVCSTDTSITGFYEVLGADVKDELGISDTARGTYGLRYSLRVRKVGGFVAPRLETSFAGTVLTNGHSIVEADARPWHGTPSQEQAYAFGLLSAAPSTRVGPGGTANIRDPDTADYFDNYATFGLTPANYYNMAPTVKYGAVGSRRDLVGRQTLNATDVADFEVSNGLLKIVAGNASDALLRVQSPVYATPSTVGTAVNVDVGFYSTLPAWFAYGTAKLQSGAVLCSCPECAILRLYVLWTPGGGSTSSILTVDIAMRRGARMAKLTVKAPIAQQWGIGFTTATATTAVQHAANNIGSKQTTADADGNKLLMLTAKAVTLDNVNGRIYATSTAKSVEFAVGHEVGGASAAAIDTSDVLKYQFFAAQSANTRVTVP